MADSFSYKTWFSMADEQLWFELYVWMPGGYVPGMKRKIENWHDHANFIIDTRKEGGMTMKVPLKTSDGADNTTGGHKLMDYGKELKQGKGSCFVKFETWQNRSYHSQKLLFSNLEVYYTHPQRYVFSLIGKIINVQSPEETLNQPAETVIVK